MAKPRKKPKGKASKTPKPTPVVVLPRGIDGGRVVGPVAAKVERRGWWSRLFAAPEKTGPARVDAGQLAELRESVMQEYRARAAQEAAGSGERPFTRPVLPERAPPSRSSDWLFTGFVLVSLAVIVLLLVQGGRKPDGPDGALAGLDRAIARNDDKALARSVDLPAFSEDVVSQLFGSGVLPPVSGTALVQPGLAATLAEEVETAVVEGAVYGDGTSLLKQLWQKAGGDHLQFGKPRIVTRNATSAVAEILITRDDTGQVGELLQLNIAKQGDVWRVVGSPNLGTVMASLTAIAAALPDAAQLAALGAVEPAGVGGVSPLAVTLVEKPAGQTAKTMRMRVGYANQTGQDLKGVKVRVVIGDARGVPLRVIDLEDPTTLAAGASRTRVLDVPVNRRDNIQVSVAKLPLSALTVASTVRAIN